MRPLRAYSVFLKRLVEDGPGRAAHHAARAEILGRHFLDDAEADPDPEQEPDS